jgi:hypothetical protein
MVETSRDVAAGLTCEGKFQQAELKLHALLKQSEQLLGEEHPQTLLCQRALGILYLSQSRFNEAEMKFRLVLQTQSSLSQGREAGRTCFFLALALAHQGKFCEAEAYSQFAFQEAQAELGPDYPTTLLYRGLLRQLQDEAREFSREEDAPGSDASYWTPNRSRTVFTYSSRVSLL